MVIINRLLTLTSENRRELIDITRQVAEMVDETKVRNGLCTISVPHATAAIIANENERGLVEDILRKIEGLFPSSGKYAHNAIDDNADAHLAAAFLGHARSFTIMNGSMVRGTWQSIFLVELDGPRTARRVHIQIIGER